MSRTGTTAGGAMPTRRSQVVAAAGGQEVELEAEHRDGWPRLDRVAVGEAQAGGVHHRHRAGAEDAQRAVRLDDGGGVLVDADAERRRGCRRGR